MSLDVPAEKKVTRRKLSVAFGGKVKELEIYLKVVPPGMPGWQNVEYVSGPAFMVAIRKVDAKADRAIGISQRVESDLAETNHKVEALQNVAVHSADRFDQYFGPDGNGGYVGKRFENVEGGLTQDQAAIKQLRAEVDRLSRALASRQPNAQSSSDVAALYQRLADLEATVQALENARVKTGVFHKEQLGKAAGLQPLPDNTAPPSTGGVSNPIQ